MSLVLQTFFSFSPAFCNDRAVIENFTTQINSTELLQWKQKEKLPWQVKDVRCVNTNRLKVKT